MKKLEIISRTKSFVHNDCLADGCDADAGLPGACRFDVRFSDVCRSDAGFPDIRFPDVDFSEVCFSINVSPRFAWEYKKKKAGRKNRRTGSLDRTTAMSRESR
jgi:hypothetical protein